MLNGITAGVNQLDQHLLHQHAVNSRGRLTVEQSDGQAKSLWTQEHVDSLDVAALVYGSFGGSKSCRYSEERAHQTGEWV